jgi:hypothetical protein
MKLFVFGMLAVTLSVLLVAAVLHGFDQEPVMHCLTAAREL